MNLFSKNTVIEKHFADSYLGLEIIFKIKPFEETQSVYDFGSGNGFPGLVAAIMRPESEFVLVERNQKKVLFLKSVLSELDMKNVRVFRGQARCLAGGSVQYGMSRAMAPLPRFLIETKNITTVGGQIFLFKGKNWKEEARSCSSKILKFWQIREMGSYVLGNRKFFIITGLRI